MIFKSILKIINVVYFLSFQELLLLSAIKGKLHTHFKVKISNQLFTGKNHSLFLRIS